MFLAPAGHGAEGGRSRILAAKVFKLKQFYHPIAGRGIPFCHSTHGRYPRALHLKRHLQAPIIRSQSAIDLPGKPARFRTSESSVPGGSRPTSRFHAPSPPHRVGPLPRVDSRGHQRSRCLGALNSRTGTLQAGVAAVEREEWARPRDCHLRHHRINC